MAQSMGQNQNFAKEIILEFLDYIRFKVEHDSLTVDEADSIAKTIQGEMRLVGTADDFSKFYGKSKTNVTTVIDRKMLSKPRRLVLHSFNEFRNAVPSGWHFHKE